MKTCQFFLTLLCFCLSTRAFSTCVEELNQTLTSSAKHKIPHGQFEFEGHKYWQHDQGHISGYFNTFDALALGNKVPPRKVHVFLPRGYDGKKRYPVLYLNDGQNTFFAAAGKTLNFQSILDKRASSKNQFIVVAVGASDRRAAEYTHAADEVLHQCCEAETYSNYLADELKPFIDRNYSTLSDPKNTTIGGSSLGGLAAFYTATVRSDKFGNALCQSASFWDGANDSIKRSLHSILNVPAVAASLKEAHKRPKLWIDWGGKEGLLVDRSKEMLKILRSRYGYSTKDLGNLVDPAGVHDETSWAKRLPQALNYLFGT